MLLLKHDTTRKKPVDENKVPELDASNKDSGKYKVKIIWDNIVYIKELAGHLIGLYYLIF